MVYYGIFVFLLLQELEEHEGPESVRSYTRSFFPLACSCVAHVHVKTGGQLDLWLWSKDHAYSPYDTGLGLSSRNLQARFLRIFQAATYRDYFPFRHCRLRNRDPHKNPSLVIWA